MGMYGSLRRMRADQLSRLLREPDLTSRLTDSEDEEFGWTEPWPEGPVLDLDKSWQVLHFVLTGDAWEGSGPLRNAILGGTTIGADLGYGPAHYVTPSEVAAVAVALASLSEDVIRSRFDPSAFEAAELYPGAWSPQPPPPVKKGFLGRLKSPPIQQARESQEKQLNEYFDFVMNQFRNLVGFYQDVSSAGEAALGWLV